MHLILFHDAGGADADLLRFALGQEGLSEGLVQTAYRGYIRRTRGTRYCVEPSPLSGCPEGDSYLVAPPSWGLKESLQSLKANPDGLAFECVPGPLKSQGWVVITDGRYATNLNMGLLQEVLNETDAEVVAVRARPDLVGYRERFLVTQDNRLAGVRRFYEDSMEYQPFVNCQPHHILIRTSTFNKLMKSWKSLPCDLSRWVVTMDEQIQNNVAIGVAGNELDLTSEAGFLSHWIQHCHAMAPTGPGWRQWVNHDRVVTEDSIGIRVAGPVWVHKTAKLDSDALIVGPCWIGPGAHLEAGVVVDRAIVAPDVKVEARQAVSSRVILTSEDLLNPALPMRAIQTCSPVYENPFKHWPSMSYASCVKRVVDVLVASMVLILFLPIFPVIALAIKLNSPGPIFYGARRQGLHGKVFRCLKFRSMKPGSDKLQEQLRAINEVDGPQFKMADDPRISAVGRFLRETYLDEIPQFINVLRGEMSVVGPRPSPKGENTQCPGWRDARLSVRPGITGLWQVMRTRDPVKDFQEWIQYDIEYVRKLSLKMDLWICWATFKSMMGKFAEQF